MLVINAMMRRYLLFRMRLVPRLIAIPSLTGATLVALAAVLELFGVILQVSAWGRSWRCREPCTK